MKKYVVFLLTAFYSFSQQTQNVDFKSVYGDVSFNLKEKSVKGLVKYKFTVLNRIDTLKIDAKEMQFSNVKINNKVYINIDSKTHFIVAKRFKKGNYSLSFIYEAKPKQALYISDTIASDELQIWTQGQGKQTSNWFPSFDDVNEKLSFNITVNFNPDFDVISNGVLAKKELLKGNTKWVFQMQNEMSSYLLMLAIGKYEKRSLLSNSKIPLELYYPKKEENKFESTYKDSKTIFDFLENEIGIKYPWQVYKQVPVRDFMYAGMENTTATVFSNKYVVDFIGLEDVNYANVNAHELAHQWFGNLVTAKSSTHHWLQEGLATFYALKAEKELYGDDYYYNKLYESAKEIKTAGKTEVYPILSTKASSLSVYEKAAWALVLLEQNVGKDVFKRAVAQYLIDYAFENADTDDFFNEFKKLSDYNVDDFRKIWFENPRVYDEIFDSFLEEHNEAAYTRKVIDDLEKKPLLEKKVYFTEVLKSDIYFEAKAAIIKQLKNENYEDIKDLISIAFDSKNLKLRQAVAAIFTTIPNDFKVPYETLLLDKSYQTQEISLFNLWQNFPEDRQRYLDISKSWTGFNDYNLKTLWLALAIQTEGFEAQKETNIAELVAFTSTKFEASTRQNAFEKLIGFNIITDAVLKNLIDGTTHYIWQFSKFSKNTLRGLCKNPAIKEQILKVIDKLDDNQKTRMMKVLNLENISE
jgi:aminopeptidase N